MKKLLVLAVLLAFYGCKEKSYEEEKEDAACFTYKEASTYLTENDKEITLLSHS